MLLLLLIFFYFYSFAAQHHHGLKAFIYLTESGVLVKTIRYNFTLPYHILLLLLIFFFFHSIAAHHNQGSRHSSISKSLGCKLTAYATSLH